jgi:UDP-2,3-diacylglucosamine pyrophosphatase LpxH
MPTDLHDRLLEAFLAAPKVSDVLLVARLKDPRIGYDDTKEIRVFIPDLHLLTSKDDRRYPYAFNCKEQLIGILKALKSLRKGLPGDESVTVYQLGDFVDLWRQGNDDATKILTEHFDIAGHLYGSAAALNAWFLLGNHDLDLADRGRFRVWNRRYYFPMRDPRVLLVHGDTFDWVERLPDWFQKIFVYMFGPLHDANAYDLESLRKAVRQAHGSKQYKKYIQGEHHEIGQCPSAAGGVPEDPYFNVTRVRDPGDPSGHDYLPAAYRTVQRIRAEFPLQLTTVVIGHTHHARMAIYEGGAGEFFALMDCGAWIENYKTRGEPDPRPNAQIGVMVANDCRIYQIVGG